MRIYPALGCTQHHTWTIPVIPGGLRGCFVTESMVHDSTCVLEFIAIATRGIVPVSLPASLSLRPVVWPLWARKLALAAVCEQAFALNTVFGHRAARSCCLAQTNRHPLSLCTTGICTHRLASGDRGPKPLKVFVVDWLRPDTIVTQLKFSPSSQVLPYCAPICFVRCRRCAYGSLL